MLSGSTPESEPSWFAGAELVHSGPWDPAQDVLEKAGMPRMEMVPRWTFSHVVRCNESDSPPQCSKSAEKTGSPFTDATRAVYLPAQSIKKSIFSQGIQLNSSQICLGHATQILQFSSMNLSEPKIYCTPSIRCTC